MTKRFAISTLAAIGLAVLLTPSLPANAASGASDTIIPGMTPGQIADFMKRSGYGATMKQDDVGDPMIVANGEQGKFGILFFDCAAGGALKDRACADMEFVSLYEVKNRPSLSKLNKWNAGQAFGKAYIRKDGQVALTMPINLAIGVSESFILSSLEWWASVMSEFEQQVWPK